MSFFRPNPKFPAAMDEQDSTKGALEAQAERVVPIAETYKRRIMPRKGAPPGGVAVVEEGDRVLLVNTDHGGHWDEWGNARMAPNAPLRRAVRAAGLVLREE